VSRLHPFDFVFADFASAHFPEIQREAADAVVDLGTLTRLPATQNALRILGGLDPDESVPAITEYLVLLFAAYRFWAAGRPTTTVARPSLEALLEAPPGEHAPFPDDACYVQLPGHMFWATIGEDAPHEPLDGFFVITNAGGGEVTVVAVLGLRSGREGFSQIAVTAPAAEIAQVEATLSSPAFPPMMEGGAEAGFRSVTSEAELLYLARLALDSATE
jgi:hypothetical protein